MRIIRQNITWAVLYNLTALPLAALEIPVGGRGTAVSRCKAVGIHGQAHRAARIAPVEAGFDEDLVQAFFLGLAFKLTPARIRRKRHPLVD